MLDQIVPVLFQRPVFFLRSTELEIRASAREVDTESWCSLQPRFGRQPFPIRQDQRVIGTLRLLRVGLEHVQERPHKRERDNDQEQQTDSKVNDTLKTD